MRVSRPAAILIAAAVVAACEPAAQNAGTEGYATLSGEQIITRVGGNTLKGKREADGQDYAVYVAQDGRMWGATLKGDEHVDGDEGTWQIVGNTICQNWQVWDDGCVSVLVRGGDYILVSGSNKVTARGSILSGNPDELEVVTR